MKLISSEHLKYAGMKLPIMLSLFISSSLIHGYLPCSFMTSVIVPVIKDKNKRISDKNNYRPICLSNVITKVLERVLTPVLMYICALCTTSLGSNQNLELICVCSQRAPALLCFSWLTNVCLFFRCLSCI